MHVAVVSVYWLLFIVFSWLVWRFHFIYFLFEMVKIIAKKKLTVSGCHIVRPQMHVAVVSGHRLVFIVFFWLVRVTEVEQ